MMSEKSQAISSFFFDDYYIDIHIRIYPYGNIFRAEVRVSGMKPQAFNIGLTLEDIGQVNRGLQEAINKVTHDCENYEHLFYLAKTGRAAFNRIFADGIPRETILRAIEISQINKHLGKKQVTIEISTEKFFIPWEMIYCGSLDKVEIHNFWGMQFLISRIIVQDAYPGNMVSPVMVTSCPQIGLIIGNELDYVDEEKYFLRRLHQCKKIQLHSLPSLDVTKQMDGLERFGKFLRKNVHIIHFACHAYIDDQLDLSFLRVANGFDITMRDFYSNEFEIKYSPFIILNACQTGIVDPLYISNWAMLFWQSGARGVLATEFRVPDAFAANFTEVLYHRFLLGRPIGEVLFSTRHHFWELHHNPLGLAYALYSPLAIRIATSIEG